MSLGEPLANLPTVRSVASRVVQRLKAAGVSYTAADNIAAHLRPGERDALQAEAEQVLENLLDVLVIERDHNTQETARRVAKMYLCEVFAGRYAPAPSMTEFPNAKALDEVFTLGPITIRSACSHHLVPITGRLWVGVLPSVRVIGISKFARLADWIMSRPHIQEEATVMLADELERIIEPRGLALVLDATHNCMTWRGVRESTTVMSTSIMRGAFRDTAALRAEFMTLIQATR